MAEQPYRKRCENCALWQQPDLSQQGIANAGTCTALLDRKTLPEWARGIAHRTLSFQGKDCSAHQQQKSQ